MKIFFCDVLKSSVLVRINIKDFDPPYGLKSTKYDNFIGVPESGLTALK